MPKRDRRSARERAADIQIRHMQTYRGDAFRVVGKTVTLPLALLRERLGFCYSEGEFALRARIESALRGAAK
jgi:hypothetical protein